MQVPALGKTRALRWYTLPGWPASLLPVHAWSWWLALGQRLFPQLGQRRMNTLGGSAAWMGQQAWQVHRVTRCW